tara:strand:- start:410 stop:640 length:231 start_codon:yes stop_codon:yes gene_type:complete
MDILLRAFKFPKEETPQIIETKTSGITISFKREINIVPTGYKIPSTKKLILKSKMLLEILRIIPNRTPKTIEIMMR